MLSAQLMSAFGCQSAISPQFEQVKIQLEKIQTRQDQESSLLVLDTEYLPTKPSKLLEVGLVQLNLFTK